MENGGRGEGREGGREGREEGREVMEGGMGEGGLERVKVLIMSQQHVLKQRLSNVHNYAEMYLAHVYRQSLSDCTLLTLGAHAQEGYCSCLVCVSVCLLPL